MTDQDDIGTNDERRFGGDDELDKLKELDKLEAFLNSSNWPKPDVSQFIEGIRKGKFGDELIHADDRRRLESDARNAYRVPFEKLVLMFDSTLLDKVYSILYEFGWPEESARRFAQEFATDRFWPAACEHRQSIARATSVVNALWQLAESVLHQQPEFQRAAVKDALDNVVDKATGFDLAEQAYDSLTKKQRQVIDLYRLCDKEDWAQYHASDPACSYFPPPKAEARGSTLVLSPAEIKRRQNVLRVALSRTRARMISELWRLLTDPVDEDLTDTSRGSEVDQ